MAIEAATAALYGAAIGGITGVVGSVITTIVTELGARKRQRQHTEERKTIRREKIVEDFAVALSQVTSELRDTTTWAMAVLEHRAGDGEVPESFLKMLVDAMDTYNKGRRRLDRARGLLGLVFSPAAHPEVDEQVQQVWDMIVLLAGKAATCATAASPQPTREEIVEGLAQVDTTYRTLISSL